MTHPGVIARENWGALTEGRIGVMLHYDASVTDEGSVAWLAGPDITVSYNWIVMDSGNVIPFAPQDRRAWHAGCCLSTDQRLPYRDANSAFYGLSLAATVGQVATLAAKRSIVALCRTLYGYHGWPLTDAWRVVGHRSQAVYCRGHAKAGQRGRKSDPEGPDLAHPVLNTNEIRGMLATTSA